MNGQDIKHYRKREMLSQRRLGQLIGYSEQQIARWEKGTANLTGPAQALLYVLMNWKVGASVRALLVENATTQFQASLVEAQRKGEG